jgi:hypothetical protein
MTEQNGEDYVIVWEAPVIEKPEFRLYHDDKGYVVCYTCEKLEGNYIVVDTMTFAEARPDVRVVDGRLVRVSANAVISRLYPDDEGVLCEKEDISIIADRDGIYWKMKTYELR